MWYWKGSVYPVETELVMGPIACIIIFFFFILERLALKLIKVVACAINLTPPQSTKSNTKCYSLPSHHAMLLIETIFISWPLYPYLKYLIAKCCENVFVNLNPSSLLICRHINYLLFFKYIISMRAWKKT